MRWSAATQVSNQVLRLALSVALARILSPRDFGLAAMLLVFTGFARVFISAGFGSSIVQKQDVRPEHLDTVFWVNVMTGLLLTISLAACAPAIARFYAEPILMGMTIVMAFNFLLDSFNVVQSALLQRAMNFRRLFWIEITTAITGTTGAIIFALNGFGARGLVFQETIISVVGVTVMWLSSSWKPRFRFQYSALRELLGFSGSLLATNAVTYWTRNFDTLLVGKALGSVTAGIYNRAYQLMMLPMAQVTSVAARVMFPALAVIQDDVPRVRAVYLQSTRLIGLVTFPLMLFLMVLAKPAILLVYGAKWIDSVPIFQVLCLAALVQSVGVTVSWIYTSQGRTDIQLKWALIATPIRIVAFIVGIRWGVMGMTIAYVLSGYVIILYPSWSIPGRLIGLRFHAMVGNLASTFCCAVSASGIVWGIDRAFLANGPHWLRLAVGLCLGPSIYVALLSLFRVDAWKDLVGLARDGHIPVVRRILPYLRFLPRFS